MSKFKLIAEPALDLPERDVGGITVSELSNHALVSLAIPNDARENVSKSIANNYETDIPAVGQSTSSDVDNMRFLGLQSDQFFALFEYSGDRAVEHLKSKINDVAYLCDQSDCWVILKISGKRCREALARICPIDLLPDSFPEGKVARTGMEHLAVIILHESENQYLLLSPRSSAQSFLHAVTSSIDNIS